MFCKYLFSISLCFCSLLFPLSHLHSGVTLREDGGILFLSNDRKYVRIDKGIPSLDFSNKYPDMDTFVINVSNYSPYYYWHAEDDYGLSNNVNVKTLTIAGAPSQKLLKWAHLPNVETYKLSTVYEDLDYLENALPSVKSLEVVLYSEQFYPKRSEFFKTLENISKLPNLEHLTFHMVGGWHNSGFTRHEELPIIQKMQQLKTLKFVFSNLIPGHVGFREPEFKLLKNIALPNTDIQVKTSYRQPQDGGS